MRPEHFEVLFEVEEHHWWFRAMRTIADAVAGAELSGRDLRILDAGCGSGYNIRHYEGASRTVFGFDIEAEALARARRRGFPKICQGSVTEIPFAADTFDLVFSFDVLEQIAIADIPAALREMRRVLAPGGHLYIRVPAFRWLHSSHDDDIKTVHRFTRGELEQGLAGAGFDIRLATYANSLLFPAAVFQRLLKKFGIGEGNDARPMPAGLRWLDPVFRGILSSEAAVFRAGLRLPFGLSVICYARKPADGAGHP